MNSIAFWLLRTPISAKYCRFGWWLGAWSTSSHHPMQLCDIYISGYKYTLISEWTRLFGLIRILDNLISGAVCYFLYDYFYILWNIHVTHARSCSCRHSLSWVVFYAVVRSWAWYLSPSLVPEPGRFESSGKVSGVGWASFCCLWSCVSIVWTSSPVGWLAGLVVGAGPRGWVLAAVVSLLVKGRTWTSLPYGVCVADWQPLHVLETARTLGRGSWWAQNVGVYVHFVGDVSSVFRGSCLFDFWAPWL